MTLTIEQKQNFDEKGYLHITQFYSPSDMECVSQLIDQMEKDESDPGYKYYDEHQHNSDQTVLTRIERFLFNNDDMDRLIWSQKLKRAFTDLMGKSPVVFKDKINFKLPGGKPDLLHQDQAAGWGSYTDYFLSAAVFVDKNTKKNAAMSVLNTGKYPRELMGKEWSLLANPEPPFEPASDYSLLEGNPGDIVFFDSYVPHGSPENMSDKRRRNIFITVNPKSAGNFRDVYYEDKIKTFPPNNMRDSNQTYTYRV